MPAPVSIVRKLQLTQLEPFARNARAAIAQAGVAALDHATLFQTHLSARCCLCDARPATETLAALLSGAELEAVRPAQELARLRQQYCLRSGCDSRFYEFTFVPHPTLDWAAIGIDPTPENPSGSTSLAVGEALVRKSAAVVRTQVTWKLLVALALLLAILAWRQWWTGGSIPYFREAKTFTSDGMLPEPPDAVD